MTGGRIDPIVSLYHGYNCCEYRKCCACSKLGIKSPNCKKSRPLSSQVVVKWYQLNSCSKTHCLFSMVSSYLTVNNSLPIFSGRRQTSSYERQESLQVIADVYFNLEINIAIVCKFSVRRRTLFSMVSNYLIAKYSQYYYYYYYYYY